MSGDPTPRTAGLRRIDDGEVMANLSRGDKVIATTNLGSGAGKGTKGVVTDISTWHGSATVSFETGKTVSNVKLDQIAKI